MAFTYTITTVLIIWWAVGYFNFHVGKEIHLLLILALIALSVIVMGNDRQFSKKRSKLK